MPSYSFLRRGDAVSSLASTGVDLPEVKEGKWKFRQLYVNGATQLCEVQERGARVIRRDVPAKKYALSERQAQALAFVLDQGEMSIHDYEQLCPEVNRRTLQRDLKAMVDKGLLIPEGAINQLVYRLGG